MIQCQPNSPFYVSGTNHTLLNMHRDNVGIGVGSPTEKLHVAGNVRVTGSIGIGTDYPVGRLHVRNSSNAHALRVLTDGTVIAGQLTGQGTSARVNFGDANHYIGSTWGQGLTLGTFGASNALMIQEGTGKVLISNKLTVGQGAIVSGPFQGFALCVDGMAVAREVVVTNEASYWPDYVFKTEYEILNLDSVATYISEHGHLPNVPSASDIREKGHYLMDMDMVLLRQIEELYLHVMELNRKLERCSSE